MSEVVGTQPPVGAGRSRKPRSRSRRVALLGAAVLAASMVSAAGVSFAVAPQASPAPPLAAHFAQLNPVTQLTADNFASPSQNDMPWARWNFDPATATIEGLQADIQDAYDHNIGGLEIGQGGVPTTDQLTAIYRKANSLGITISLKAANGLPGQSYSANDPYARRTLSVSRQTVAAGASLSAAVGGTGTGTIVAVLAYRCAAAPCAPSGTVPLDRSSVENLTRTLTDTNTAGYQGGSTAGTLNWTAPTAPAAADWVVLTFLAVPFGDEPETLSPQGTTEVTTAYDTYFATGLGDLVKENDGDFFVDSHSNDPWGAPEELWASDMRTQFQKRAGYDIVPDLAALVDPTMSGAGFGPTPPPTATFYSFTDGSATRIRTDFNRVRSDMFTQYRLVAFQNWAHSYNMKLRLQQEDGPYTSIGDQLETSAVLDQSEYESLTGSDQTDIYRPMASANHMTGNTWYSTECCAVLNESYAETTEDQIVRMNHEFAGGVNRIVYHVRPYIDNPTSTWPGMGFSTAKVTFANANNRTEPYYVQDGAATNAYFAREHELLTQGTAKMDVAVYQENYSSPAAFATPDPSNRHWQDLGLQRAGYTWDYLDESLFDLPNAVVTNHQLAVAGPDYKALIFDNALLPTTNTARGTMSVPAAEKFLNYAKAGLPIIFVGKPTSTGGLPASGDATLSNLVTQILAKPNTYLVSSEADVPALLRSLNISPQAKPASPSTLLSVRRSDPATGTNYYWLYNEGVDSWPGSTQIFGENPTNLYEAPSTCRTTGGVNNPCMATGPAVDTTVTLQGKGTPYTLDAFTGKITPISQFTRTGNTVTVPVKLARDASTVIALSTTPRRFGDAAASTAVTSTTADSAAQSGSTVVVRSSKAGNYRTTLSNGTTVHARIGAVPAPIDLTGSVWHLDVANWVPTNPYGTTGPAGTATTKVPVSVDLSGLRAWPDIPALANASGTGVYTTSFTLPKNWGSDEGADLSLGQVTDSFDVRVNGQAVPIDQISATADLGPYLHAGTNYLIVQVATTLNNRLYQLDPTVAARGLIQNYGLIGPVVVSPYRQTVVATR